MQLQPRVLFHPNVPAEANHNTMRLLSLAACALAVASVSAAKLGKDLDQIVKLHKRSVNTLQVVETVSISISEFSDACGQDFQLQNSATYQQVYNELFNEFLDECVPEFDINEQEGTSLITDPCEEIVDALEEFGDEICPQINAQYCGLTVDETIETSDLFVRALFEYPLCIPVSCSASEVESVLQQALDQVAENLLFGVSDDQFESTSFLGTVFCDAEGVPARFGSGSALNISISGESNANGVEQIIIQSPRSGNDFSVATTVAPRGNEQTGEVYGFNAAAELNADESFNDAGCVAYWDTQSTAEDSRLQIFCPASVAIYVADGNGDDIQLLTVEEDDDPVSVSFFGFIFSTDGAMEDFETPEDPIIDAIITTARNRPGQDPPVPTLGENSAAAMAPTALLAAASLVVAALAL